MFSSENVRSAKNINAGLSGTHSTLTRIRHSIANPARDVSSENKISPQAKKLKMLPEETSEAAFLMVMKNAS